MVKILKNTLLSYIPTDFDVEEKINPNRIFILKDADLCGNFIVYLCERELRAKDNFALQLALQKSKEFKLPLRIIYPKKFYECKRKQDFINEQINNTQNAFKKLELDFEVYVGDIEEYLKHLGVAVLVIDFNPILDRGWLKNLECSIYEVDGHNIIPSRFVSDKQEYSAATLRRKIYQKIYPFLTEYKNFIEYSSDADLVLKNFIENKLSHYADFKNNPTKSVLSGLSKYLNLGFISSQRVALEVVRADVPEINKESFLEELIIRKELADNFCLYCDDYKGFGGVPIWAQSSLNYHKNDIRSYNYSLYELEGAQTHDILWNAAQKQLLSEGIIHGYLRMYWAKKILEWTLEPEIALEYAIHLNDKFAYDAPSSSGYVNILWAIAGLHDRAFADYPVSGKIRRMTYNSLKTKFDVQKYIQKYI